MFSILLLILLNNEIAHAITCVSFSGSGSSGFQTKTNVTGPGNACCPVRAWAGLAFGIDYEPYDSTTEMCCKGRSTSIAGIIYQSASIGKGNDCCNELAYDNRTGICCSVYNLDSQTDSNNAGPGDTCCGTKPYFKNKQECCTPYIPALKLKLYEVADACCNYGLNPYNKTYQVCCNKWNYGDGDSCCNLNGMEDAYQPPDEPFYKKEKCCVKGKLYNYGCANKGDSLIVNNFIFAFFVCVNCLFYLI